MIQYRPYCVLSAPTAIQQFKNNKTIFKSQDNIVSSCFAPQLPQLYILVYISELVLRSRTVLGIEYVRDTWLGGNQNPREFDIFHGILVEWEQRDMMSVGVIWIGMERGHLLGYGLDGYGNCDLSRDRSHSPFPWKYRGKSTAGIFPRGALIISHLENRGNHTGSTCFPVRITPKMTDITYGRDEPFFPCKVS